MSELLKPIDAARLAGVSYPTQFDLRIDHRLSEKTQIFGRLSFAQDVSDPVAPLRDGSGNITSGAIGLTDTRAQNTVGSMVHVSKTGLLTKSASDTRAGQSIVTRYSSTCRHRTVFICPGIPTNGRLALQTQSSAHPASAPSPPPVIRA